MDSGKCALTGYLPVLRPAWFSGQEGSAWRSPMATENACAQGQTKPEVSMEKYG